ncbi:FAD-binding domain-containing protein [Patellaria atrata CBS 101060]|uniref:FAD-binding domain-containing protein n=1 Tax=Patellaria atrata CBS 101060 TaxID=1346257 RepID=A0A9P4SDT4_9PEZI|nr:FAD-binding domain-containing protein [Patellaria atrata CBS 101060]
MRLSTLNCSWRTSALLFAGFCLQSTSVLANSDVERIGLFEYEKSHLSLRALEDTLYGSDRGFLQFEDVDSKFKLRRKQAGCKVYPGDPEWPSEETWESFKNSVDGNLIKTVPRAAVCYPGPDYDEQKCTTVTATWTDSYAQSANPVEVLSPAFQGLTCQPPTLFPNGNCTLGGYPVYVVDARKVSQIQLAVRFARDNGIRLVIKNTGHDFLGKSLGAGALSIWTHNLKGITFISDYQDDSSDYQGPAFKVGAGVQGYELYKAAEEQNLVVVAGEGETVGVMGGYIQGGGHSPLSSILGIAADHVLEIQVVTPDGQFLTVNSKAYSDLFWALRGGGGSTFGVVTSVTVKAHKNVPVTVGTFQFSAAETGLSTFWSGVRAYFDTFIPYSNAGVYTYFWIFPPAITGNFLFSMQPFFLPNKTLSETESLLEPFLIKLTSLGISVTPNLTHYNTFYPAWRNGFPLERVATPTSATGSRLFPRTNWESENKLDATFDAIKAASDAGNLLIAFNIAPRAQRGGSPNNAVNPAWRKAVMHAISGASWALDATPAEVLKVRETFQAGVMQKWRDVSPGAGAYLGEADILEPSWQQAFYGSNYQRLKGIKEKYDPQNVFWAPTAVGSEKFKVITEDGLPGQNGKLCEA